MAVLTSEAKLPLKHAPANKAQRRLILAPTTGIGVLREFGEACPASPHRFPVLTLHILPITFLEVRAHSF